MFNINKYELIVVDYKATSKTTAVSLDADWQIAYKRQAEIYQWLLRKNDFSVSNIAYFVYVMEKTARALIKNFFLMYQFCLTMVMMLG